MSFDPRVDAYIRKSAPFAKPILTHLRAVVHRACPDVVETMKWSFPHFDYKGIFCGMAAFKAHCTFGFWKHALLAEQLPAVDSKGMGQFGRIASLDDLPAEAVLARVIKAAAKLNDAGVKVVRRKAAPKPPMTPPAYFVAALKKNRKAAAAFEAFPPGHRREYLEWITEAKTEETRDRRLGQAIAWMAEGKSRNWKYERAR
jgi:hypothetical protein